MQINYSKTCSDLLKDLSDRTQDVIVRRFGLESGTKETLESIGSSYGITRERVRQIEFNGLAIIGDKIQKNHPIFQNFKDALDRSGGIKREDILLNQLGGERFGPQAAFLLNMSPDFKRFSDTEKTYAFWIVGLDSWKMAKSIIKDLCQRFSKKRQTLSLEECQSGFSIKPEALVSCLEISKEIGQGPDGKFGLRDWPEINPRGVKDKAFLVFQREKRPLHFSQVANLIGDNALVQTVHNELIRDSRFVLVGRGIYALTDWGYQPGTVKDVISNVLTEANAPLSKDEILKKVSEQRIVKENTILLNLSNQKQFLRNSQGKYFLRDA